MIDRSLQQRCHRAGFVLDSVFSDEADQVLSYTKSIALKHDYQVMLSELRLTSKIVHLLLLLIGAFLSRLCAGFD